MKQWATDFFAVLDDRRSRRKKNPVVSLKGVAERKLIDAYEQAQSRLLLLDYDGTIVDYTTTPDVANPSAAVIDLIRQLALAHPYSFVLAMGDDRTDEDMFSVLTGPEQFTIKVGKGPTQAKYRLDSVQQVLSLVNELLTVHNLPSGTVQ